MAGKKTRDHGSNDQKARGWERLTWDDLRSWAGSRDLDKGRSYTHRVSQLQITADGRLLAWVTGTQRYAATARLTQTGTPISECSCPLQIDGCKHGVAVVLAFLEILKQKKSVPSASDNDSRWTVLRDIANETEHEFEEDDFSYDDVVTESEDDVEGDEDFDEGRPLTRPRRNRRQRAERGLWNAKKSEEELREFLRSKSADELIELLLDCAERDCEFRTTLQEQQALLGGKVTKLVQAARREIERVTSEPAWVNSWHDDSSLPNYEGVKRRLQTLLDAGHSDTVVELGRDLLARGLEQVGESHDEGETGEAIADSLNIVFNALMKSSLAPHEKLLFTFDALMQDDYGIIEVDFLIDHEWTCKDWSLVADELASRLRTTSTSNTQDSTRSYARDQLSSWLILALEKSGRANEVLPLCESEARTNGSYERLVKRLLDEKRCDDAERWARDGIANTPGHLLGIVRNLKETLRGIAEQRKDWPLVAAFAADEFFEYPKVESFEELVKVAQQAGCGDQVESAARKFLETGVRPDANVVSSTTRAKSTKNGKSKVPASKPPLSSWPLPSLNLPEPRVDRERNHWKVSESPSCHLNVLLELALKANQPDEILLWFDKNPRMAARRGNFGNNIADRVATAVASMYPNRSLELWMRMIDAEIAATSPAHYEVAAVYLRKVRDHLANLDRATEWTKYLASLRETHRRKRRLVEILDGLAGRPIVSF